jgi:two-component system, LytTR family, response regulator LytT
MSKKILIIEDEILAYDRLKDMLLQLDNSLEIYPQVYSIKGSVDFFGKAKQVDLIFMDIHLSDGVSFEIFKQCQVTSPIIFVTAYDEYALQAFKLNSLDYLMKPLQDTELKTALDKFERFAISEEVLKNLAERDSKFIKQLNLKIGNKHFQVNIKDVCSFYSKEKLSFVFTNDGKHYPIDLSLDKLSDSTDPEIFFRVNRHLLVQRSNIKGFATKEKSKLLVNIEPMPPVETNVSSEKSAEFKDWFRA